MRARARVCVCALTLEVVEHQQHQCVAAQRSLAGVVDLVVTRPLLHRHDDRPDPEVRWRRTDHQLGFQGEGVGGGGPRPMANIVGNTPTGRF